jgi:hypothetical protein
MSDIIVSPHEQLEAVRYTLLAGRMRGLQLDKRMPELMKRRGWPAEDDDLRSVLQAAVVLKTLGAGATLIKRPPSADALGDVWPDGKRTASQIVDALELHELLEQQL